MTAVTDSAAKLLGQERYIQQTPPCETKAIMKRHHAAWMLLLVVPTIAQERPRIGVALEGGGALGLAHIGVLERLEKLHIPIDYIAGSSMGALVGGLYAMGYSPAQIRALVAGIDWDELLRGEVPFRDLIYRRKEDRRAYPNGIELGLRNGLALPSGLNSGQQVGLIFDRAALPYSRIKTFDELPIPFRCVATELGSAKKEVFRDGSLSKALRASMAIPGFFTPVQLNGKTYVDGGFLDNLPVGVVREMGADVVIAVHLQPKKFDLEDVTSPVGMLGSSMRVVIAANELQSMLDADILISVPLEEFEDLEYKRFAEIIPRGEEAAGDKARVLGKFSVDEAGWRAYRSRVDARKPPDVPTPQFVEIRGAAPAHAEIIRREFGRHLDRPVTPAEIEDTIGTVMGMNRYSRIDYGIGERNGQLGLIIDAEEKRHIPPVINPGVFVDGSDTDNVRFSVGARLTLLDFGGHRGELRTDIIGGGQYGATSEYFRPLGSRTGWFVAVQGFATQEQLGLYSGSSRIAEYRNRAEGAAADVGHIFGHSAEFRTGYRLSHVSLIRRIGEPVLADAAGWIGITSARLNIDRMENPIIPRSGVYLRSRVEWWDKNLGAPDLPLAEINLTAARPISRTGSVFVQGAGGTTFGRNSALPVFTLGGVNRLSAYGLNQFLTNQYFLGRAGYIHELGKLPVLVGRGVWAAGTYEIGKAYGIQQTRLPNDASAGLILETLFGPVFIGGAIGDTGHRKWYFQMGRFF